MWILYYKNIERVNQLASQIQPEITKEKTEKKRNKISANAGTKGKFKLSFFKNIFNSSASINGSGSYDSELDTVRKIEYNTDDVQLNNVIDKLQNLNLTVIDQNCNIQNLQDISEIIRFRGDCTPQIDGNSMSERLANYEKIKQISWTSKINSIKIIFITNKESLISSTPISYALAEKNGTLFLDGFGAVINKKNNSIKIIPIIIGTRLSNHES
jgi:hypothetical protein